jgi:hypothetical protein
MHRAQKIHRRYSCRNCNNNLQQTRILYNGKARIVIWEGYKRRRSHMTSDGLRRAIAGFRVPYPAGNGSPIQRLIERVQRGVARVRSALTEIYLTPRGDAGDWESGIRGL